MTIYVTAFYVYSGYGTFDVLRADSANVVAPTITLTNGSVATIPVYAGAYPATRLASGQLPVCNYYLKIDSNGALTLNFPAPSTMTSNVPEVLY